MSETKRALTPEQIKNWRGVLSLRIGPVAYLLPDAEIQRMRDAMQDSLLAKADGKE